MTTAVESVSSAVRRYAASVSEGTGAVPDVFDQLAHYVVGGLEPGETVVGLACLRNLRPDWTTAATLAVLTDRAVLLAEEGTAGQRISLVNLVDVKGMDVSYGGARYSGLDLSSEGAHRSIVAAPVDGWNYELARAELQTFATQMMGAAARARAEQRAVAVQPAAQEVVTPPPTDGYPAAETPLPSKVGDTGAAVPAGDEGYGKARFVGDAAPVGGIPLSRLFNSICYVIAGIALLVMSQLPDFPSGGSMALAIVIGLGAIAYGAKIVLTRTSYWVSSWVYILAFGSVAAMFGLLAH